MYHIPDVCSRKNIYKTLQNLFPSLEIFQVYNMAVVSWIIMIAACVKITTAKNNIKKKRCKCLKIYIYLHIKTYQSVRNNDN